MRVAFEMNIQPDQPTINGRIYSKEICEKMVKDLNEKQQYLYMGVPTFIDGSIQHPSIEKIAGVIEHAQLDDSKIIIDSVILDTNCGKDVQSLLKVQPFSVCCTPYGIGSINGNEIQDDYQITSVHLIPKERSI